MQIFARLVNKQQTWFILGQNIFDNILAVILG